MLLVNLFAVHHRKHFELALRFYIETQNLYLTILFEGRLIRKGEHFSILGLLSPLKFLFSILGNMRDIAMKYLQSFCMLVSENDLCILKLYFRTTLWSGPDLNSGWFRLRGAGNFLYSAMRAKLMIQRL